MSIKHFTKDNFAQEVTESKGLVLVDFWAGYCAPCMALAPVFEEFAAQLDDDVTAGKINTQDETQLAVANRVMSIPTIVLFKDGKEVERIVGPHPDNAPELFSEMIARHK